MIQRVWVAMEASKAAFASQREVLETSVLFYLTLTACRGKAVLVAGCSSGGGLPYLPEPEQWQQDVASFMASGFPFDNPVGGNAANTSMQTSGACVALRDAMGLGLNRSFY